MLRIRSKVLMSGVSSIAMLAAFGLSDPVLAAGVTITGATNPNPPQHITVPTTFLNINTGAIVTVDGAGNSVLVDPAVTLGGGASALSVSASVLNGAITNNGLIESSNSAIFITGSTIAGGITNHGTILGDTNLGSLGDGIHLAGVTSFSGGITNTGTIVGGSADSAIDIGSTGGSNIAFSGGVTNSGSIVGGIGINLGVGNSFVGGITNSVGGTITGTNGQAIRLNGDSFAGGITNSGLVQTTSAASAAVDISGASFTGGILNNATGTIQANAATGVAISFSGGLFTGGITNSGKILATGATGVAINLTGTTFQGGITNNAGGSIVAVSSAIHFSGALFEGDVTNSGLISSTAGNAIDVTGAGTFDGIINNAGGTITALHTAIFVSNNLFEGGITNAGLIRSTGSDHAINLTSTNTTFDGGITNQAGGTIQAGGATTTILVNSTTFSGGISNSGLIQASNEKAIRWAGTTFNGGITNSGTIVSKSSTAIYLSGTTFNGGISNSGTIISNLNGYGLYAGATTFNGGITNLAGGTIQAGKTYTGLYIAGTTFNGGVSNAGLISSGSTDGYGIYVSSTSFAGGIGNTGTIRGHDTGIYVSSSTSTFDGGITNTGSTSLIEATVSGYGIYTNATTFNGGITNQGTIKGADGNSITGTAISINGTTFNGGINNSGLIVSGTSQGYAIYLNATTFNGGITNSGTIKGHSTAIYVNDTLFTGGISNTGTIWADPGYAIYVNSPTFTGGIQNTGSGALIQSDSSTAIEISGNVNSFGGGITNTGTILAHSTGNDAIYINANTFSGGVTNGAGGVISASDTGLQVSTTTFTGGISNQGTIESIGGGDGVAINGASFTGGVANSGTISSVSDAGLELDVNSFSGGITNTGSGHIIGGEQGIQIDSSVANFLGGIALSGTSGLVEATNGTAMTVDAINFSGGISNAGTILSPLGVALEISSTNFTGNVDNSGLIHGSATAVLIQGVGSHLLGNFTNSGTIISDSNDAVLVQLTTFDGSITNSGLIQAPNGDGIDVAVGTTVSGNVTNSGTITASNIGIDINGTVDGTVTNSGLIDPNIGIKVNGTVIGGIFNSGTILANVTGIDLTTALTGTTITQTAGLIEGNSTPAAPLGTGTVTTAINMDQTGAPLNDVFNANGGAVDGNIVGDGGVHDEVFVNAAASATGNFAYLRGTASGIDRFDVISGEALLGASEEGGVGNNGIGVIIGANQMNVGAVGTAYLDDNTTVNLTGAFAQNATGTLKYFLTTDTSVHGSINAGTTATQAGTLVAVIDGASFAANNAPTFTYANIITDTTQSGAFDPVTTSSIFFTGKANYFTTHTDLTITRVSFADALALDLLTHNQNSVGGAVETIFENGGYSANFTDLFAYLFGLPNTPAGVAEIQRVYDELAGAEHAQTQNVNLSLASQFTTLLGERFDDAKIGFGGAQWSSLGDTRYAQAVSAMASDASSTTTYGGQGLTRGPSGVAIWGKGYGDWTNVNGDAEATGYDQNTGGVVAGADVAVESNAMLGVAGRWSSTNVDFTNPGSHDKIDTWQVGGYGTYGFGRFYVDGTFSYADNKVDARRILNLGFNDFTAMATYNAKAWQGNAALGAIFTAGRVNLQPMVSVNYTNLDTDGYTETGAQNFNLIVNSQNTDSLTSDVALRATGHFNIGSTNFIPDLKVAWRHEYNDGRQSFDAAFLEDPNTIFNIESSRISADSAVLQAGFVAGLTQNVNIFAHYNGLYNSDATSNAASGGVTLTW